MAISGALLLLSSGLAAAQATSADVLPCSLEAGALVVDAPARCGKLRVVRDRVLVAFGRQPVSVVLHEAGFTLCEPLRVNLDEAGNAFWEVDASAGLVRSTPVCRSVDPGGCTNEYVLLDGMHERKRYGFALSYVVSYQDGAFTCEVRGSHLGVPRFPN